MIPRRLPSFPLALALVVSGLAGCGSGHLQDSDPTPASQAWLEEIMDRARARIQEVEGVPFTAPVRGVLLPAGSFDSLVRALDAQGFLGDEDPPAWDLSERTMASLGMVESLGVWGPARQAFDGGSILGFYLPATKSLYVFRDPDLEQLRHTILHEMVHAFQDQLADLDATSARIREADEDRGFGSLVEGEAEYLSLAVEMGNPSAAAIEDSLAVLRLPLDSLAFYLERWGTPQGIPLSMTLPEYMPYIQGPDMVSRVRLAGSMRSVDSMFASPPRSSREVLWSRPAAVDDWNPGGCPAVSGSWRPLQTGRFGAVHLASLLYGSLPAGSGFEAILGGWTGDRFWSFESDSARPGILWRLRFESAGQARAFASAFAASRAGRRERWGLASEVDSLDAKVAATSDGRVASIVRVSGGEVAIAEGFPRAEAEGIAGSLLAMADRDPIAARSLSAEGTFPVWTPPRPPVPLPPPPRVFGR